MVQVVSTYKTFFDIVKKKKIGIKIVGFVLLAVIILSIVVELEAPQKKESLYADGQRRALIIFHPSWQYHFQEELTFAFAKGLNSSGWAVDRITTSSKNLTSFYSYEIIAPRL